VCRLRQHGAVVGTASASRLKRVARQEKVEPDPQLALCAAFAPRQESRCVGDERSEFQRYCSWDRHHVLHAGGVGEPDLETLDIVDQLQRNDRLCFESRVAGQGHVLRRLVLLAMASYPRTGQTFMTLTTFGKCRIHLAPKEKPRKEGVPFGAGSRAGPTLEYQKTGFPARSSTVACMKT
jgi:hypothetical protein